MGGQEALKILQVNLNRCGVAQQLLEQAAVEKDVDIVIVSEPYRCKVGPSWFHDQENKASIWVSRRLSESGLSIRLLHRAKGFVVIGVGDATYTSVYFSPNSGFEDFLDRINELDTVHSSLAQENIIIAGDFNASSPVWGSLRQDRRGSAVLDLCAKLRLTPVRSEGKFSFERNGRVSLIDIILCSTRAFRRLQGSTILPDYNGSDHRYVLHSFGAAARGPSSSGPLAGKFCLKKFADLFAKHLRHWTPREWSSLTDILALIDIITICVLSSTSQPLSIGRNRKGAWWWNPTIGSLRTRALGSRRKLQRAYRRNSSNEEVELLRAQHKLCQQALKKEIRTAKADCWERYLLTIENDPWGRPYKTVMKALKGGTPPVTLDNEAAIEIINRLFVTHGQTGKHRESPWVGFGRSSNPPISTDEVRKAINKLKHKAPGLDGVPANAMKYMFQKAPEVLTNIFRGLFEKGVFPPQWKVGRLILIPKKPPRLDSPQAWRPICVLSTWAKVLEEIIKNRIVANTGVAENQYGFRKGRCTSDSINAVIQVWNDAKAKGAHCLLTTIDVRNAFNAVTWMSIMDEVHSRLLPSKVSAILRDYLNDRGIVYQARDGPVHAQVFAGVPQGSILGPTLWNLVYDSLLSLRVPPGIRLVGYADDVAIVALDRDLERIRIKTQDTLKLLGTWFRKHHMQLAQEKTEMVLLTGRRVKEHLTVNHGSTTVTAGAALRYLGVIIDGNIRYRTHLRSVCDKALGVSGALARITPNIGGGGFRSRLLHYRTVESVVLYAAPNWISDVSARANAADLRKVQRTALVRVVRAYRTVSLEALCVLAGCPPLELLADERRRVFARHRVASSCNGTQESRSMTKREEREATIGLWQDRWSRAPNGRWTFQLINKLKPWINSGPKLLTFHLTQVCTGHGCFGKYLAKIGRRDSPLCWFGCAVPDDAEHTIFTCGRWAADREATEAMTGPLNASNFIDQLMDTAHGPIVRNFVEQIMKTKEDYERSWEIARKTRKKG